MKKILLVLLGAYSFMNMAYAATAAYMDANVGINTTWTSAGFSGNGGYMFNKYIGAEGGITYSSSYWMFDGTAKGVLPLNSQFDLYGKLGLAFNSYCSCSCSECSSHGHNTNVGLLLGAGVEFNLNKQTSLHLEDYTSTGSNPNFLMFGAQYNF